jgi:Fe-S cluster assembly protein SufD
VTTTLFRDQFAAFSANGGGEGPAWLPALRRRAFERFDTLGFPTTRDEDWHYTSVSSLTEIPFARAAAPTGKVDLAALAPYLVDQAWHRLVFVNGRFARELSAFAGLPAEVSITTLADAIATEPGFVEQHLGTMAGIEQNAFAALNTAFVTDGVVVRLPADCVVDAPLHILWVSDAASQRTAVVPARAGARRQARAHRAHRVLRQPGRVAVPDQRGDRGGAGGWRPRGALQGAA